MYHKNIGVRVTQMKRFLIASAVLFITALVWNALVYLVFLKEANLAIQDLKRNDFSDMLWLSLILTAGISCLFVWGYSRFAKNGSLREGILFGLFFALTAGLLVDLNQYILYPISASLAFKWFLGGVVEFVLYGIIVSKLYSVTSNKRQA
jgi:magnesium-transporting ATPase (P-type)